jgi:PAS domain S-box-containing protein
VQEAIDFFARKFTGLVQASWTNDEMITVRANDPACVAADAFVRPVGPPHSNYRYTILPEEAGTRSQTRAVVQEFIGLLMGTMPDALPRISVRLVGKPGLPSHSCLTVLLAALCFLGSTNSVAETKKNVLVLFASVKYSDEFLSAIEPSIRSRVPGPITFYDAYLDDRIVEEDSHRESQAETFRRRYSNVKMDVVIACNPQAFHFAVEYRDKIFPGVPIVFTAIGKHEFEREKISEGVTGLITPLGFRETIDLALRLQPDTRSIAVVAGVTAWDADFLGIVHSELVRYQSRVNEIDLVGAPDPQLLKRVDSLPPHTIVLFQVYPQFSNQPDFGTWDLLTEIAQRRPTYSVFPRLCINGCIGGAFENNGEESLTLAELASRILLGEKPENVPIVYASDFHKQVDWRALERWHISESALPPGSIVLYRDPSLWERGRKYFLIGLSIIVVQALLIFGLLWQRAQKKKTESALRKSEEKFSKSFRHSPLAITIVSASDHRYLEVNEAFEQQTGWKRIEVIGKTALELSLWVDSDQRSLFIQQLLAHGNVQDIEFHFRRKDGQIRTALGSAELIDVNTQPCALSVVADITERKRAEEALASLSGRLIEAQEAERTRIARELHDDINQRLAMVAVNLKTLKRDLPNPEAETGQRIEGVCAQVSELESDVQSLSHRLHSSKLEYLGLEAASSSFCRELSERQNAKIDFRCQGSLDEVSAEVSLCLFRVLQEALHNALKYSGVDQFQVSLIGTSNEIRMQVHDSGAGFDPDIARNGHGLGLTSMKERLRLVHGQLAIESKPQFGTTVIARVPLTSPSSNAFTAA